MKRFITLLAFSFVCQLLPFVSSAQPVIYVNQVAFDANAAKIAILRTDSPLKDKGIFSLINTANSKIASYGKLMDVDSINDWTPGKFYYQANFTAFKTAGNYTISINIAGRRYYSDTFSIGKNALAKITIPAIVHYYNQQRANTPQELEADAKLLLHDSSRRVDLRGGWCDASGDVSKYFSHLAYANFVSPQQIPLVAWSMASTLESIPGLLSKLGVKDSLMDEALYGADYMMRSLSEEGYFYMIVFSYFNKDPAARRVVGLLANSVTTNQYQSAFREGAGMAIAALARISQWKKNGAFTSEQYLEGAKRAFSHLLVHNKEYDDDGKENIIDDYCALMAASELWIATSDTLYRDEARKRAGNLAARLSPQGYFIANDANRPFWHAADAGLPVVALARYLKKETDPVFRVKALSTIKKALDYNLRVTANEPNPFGYARQSFLYHGKVKDGFFIPHENETGWWWQGENARLASLATAAIVGGRLVYPQAGGLGTDGSLINFASRQLSWILGCNPYATCFMYGFGKNNVPYMASNFGHGSQRGGISNGITGKSDSLDGGGIDFKREDNGNEWRWTEQWIPHAAWFLQAVAAMAEESGLK